MKTLRQVCVFDLETSSHSVGLVNYLGQNRMESAIDLFTGETNPDKLRIDDTDYIFVNIEYQDTIYVVYIDVEYKDNGSDIETILYRFFSDDYRLYFEKQYSCWQNYRNNCIAFRDGRGITYTIWKYTDC
ncbi:hypothetical protein M2451_004065 [Dysgonomonas sp. PFB1-18]|uniref:hypothetical protein n=1 Tax=unclassified Dysgonomonas TaxID=2630389 RepID=UPI002473C5E1|nr:MULTISPECIES: hypothetical protein [unclassified Dysgonomonas]MDH6310896.1 hypothetical protein [Dysgonomonas sp. PF1-14]MDH6341035.1 hypothetical protein [Dysgonomonas sp. PF1-16]MDH6382718.1 hypothetical protein [Dysgonomonas sp. PFB1-18]MDH6400019.1 hypothetical protein [Dysgonomonas sp. PF1-23]